MAARVVTPVSRRASSGAPGPAAASFSDLLRSPRAAGFAAALLALAILAGPVRAQLPIEETGRSLTLPTEIGDHWFWVSDFVLSRAALFDADTATMLGMVQGGPELRPLYPRVSRKRGEIYVVETMYSRGHRGERTDLVTIYDSTTLDVLGDVVVPPRTADGNLGPNIAAVLEGDRFLAALNQDPGTSVTIVDLESRKVASVIDTAGCALIYPAGRLRFAMLCGDGKAMLVTLGNDGNEASRTQSEKFFDATDNPVSDKGARLGDSWYFTTYDGQVHEVDVSGDVPAPREAWSLVTNSERERGWRPGGRQHLAIHEASGRLYSIMHEGAPGTHKKPGYEIWVYDLATKKRIQRIDVTNLLIPFLITQASFSTTMESGEEQSDSWLDSVARAVMGMIIPSPGADTVVVTPDDAPLLIVGNGEVGAVAVFDAMSGEHLRDVAPSGIAGGGLTVQ